MTKPEKNILVFIEIQNGSIAEVSLELISEARRLAAGRGYGVAGIAVGNGIAPLLPATGQYGCDRVYCIENPRLATATSVPYAKLITSLVRRLEPEIVLFGATTTGRDLAPRVASALRCGLTADCTELAIGDHRIKKETYPNVLHQIRPAFGGNIVATIVSPESRPSMATVREGVMRLTRVTDSKPAAVLERECDLTDTDFPTQVIDVIREKTCINLKGINVIVSAGMGAADPEALQLVQQLASVLGGEVACSRPVADASLMERGRQVGQTGVTVRPTLYIACGISGQIQHRAGMSDSSRIIAINKDPDAPIFTIAHYGIVGDVHEVLPQMIRSFKNKC